MRFYHDYDNRRGTYYGAGMKAGCSAHTRGWHAGVRVSIGVTDDDQDLVAVWMTGGSNSRHGDVYLGVVTDTSDGPRWTPGESWAVSTGDLAGKLLSMLSDADLDDLDRETLEQLAALRLAIAGKLSAPAADPFVFGSPLAGNGS